jgi:hypothetical protein
MAVPGFFQLAPPLLGLAAMLAVLANGICQVMFRPVNSLIAAFGVGLNHPSARNHHDGP